MIPRGYTMCCFCICPHSIDIEMRGSVSSKYIHTCVHKYSFRHSPHAEHTEITNYIRELQVASSSSQLALGIAQLGHVRVEHVKQGTKRLFPFNTTTISVITPSAMSTPVLFFFFPSFYDFIVDVFPSSFLT